jgi:hypothetical protein
MQKEYHINLSPATTIVSVLLALNLFGTLLGVITNHIAQIIAIITGIYLVLVGIIYLIIVISAFVYGYAQAKKTPYENWLDEKEQASEDEANTDKEKD